MCACPGFNKRNRRLALNWFLIITRNFVARLIFIIYCFVAVWRVTQVLHSDIYWLLLMLLLPLAIDLLYSIIRPTSSNSNQFSKWITPNVLFYLICAIPCIWLLEIELLNERLAEAKSKQPMFNEKRQCVLVVEAEMCTNDSGSTDNILMKVSNENWTLALQQLLIFALVLPKWISPKGKDTSKDELSQLLIVNIAAGADILELLETFNEEEVQTNENNVYLIMSVWTWSLLQFILVLTEKLEFPEEDEEENSRRSNQNPVQDSRNTVRTHGNGNIADTNGTLNENNKHSSKSDSSEKRQEDTEPEIAFKFKQSKKDSELFEIENEKKKDNEKRYATVDTVYKVEDGKNIDIGNENKKATKSDESLNRIELHQHEEAGGENVNTSSNNNYNVSAAQSHFEAGSTTETYQLSCYDHFSFIFYNEVWSVIAGILFQDGPFFIVRMIILFHYNVISHMNIFFTIKNIFIICLYLNRIIVVFQTQRVDWLEDMRKFKNQENPKKSLNKQQTERSSRGQHRRRPTWRSLTR